MDLSFYKLVTSIQIFYETNFVLDVISSSTTRLLSPHPRDDFMVLLAFLKFVNILKSIFIFYSGHAGVVFLGHRVAKFYKTRRSIKFIFSRHLNRKLPRDAHKLIL